MARAAYRVTDPMAPRRAADPAIGALAERMLSEVQALTPVDTGRLRAGWKITPGEYLAVRLIGNDVPYVWMVEFGTKNRPATPMLGPVLARHRNQAL